jgi:accessory gene regulator B
LGEKVIAKAAKIINSFIFRYSDISEEDSEIYQYGFEIMISSVLSAILALLIGVLTANAASGAVFLLCVVPLRQYTGGYHAGSYFMCNLIFSISCFTVIMMSRFLTGFLSVNLIKAILLLSCIVVINFSPVANKNKPITEEKKRKCKIISVITLLILGVCSIIAFYLKPYYGALITFSLLFVMIMIIIEIFLQRRNYGNEN